MQVLETYAAASDGWTQASTTTISWERSFLGVYSREFAGQPLSAQPFKAYVEKEAKTRVKMLGAARALNTSKVILYDWEDILNSESKGPQPESRALISIIHGDRVATVRLNQGEAIFYPNDDAPSLTLFNKPRVKGIVEHKFIAARAGMLVLSASNELVDDDETAYRAEEMAARKEIDIASFAESISELLQVVDPAHTAVAVAKIGEPR